MVLSKAENEFRKLVAQYWEAKAQLTKENSVETKLKVKELHEKIFTTIDAALTNAELMSFRYYKI